MYREGSGVTASRGDSKHINLEFFDREKPFTANVRDVELRFSLGFGPRPHAYGMFYKQID